MSDFLWPHGLQHARLPCPSLSPRVGSNSCLLSYLTISSSVIPFSFCLESFLALGFFQWVSSSYKVAKVLELSISPSNEYSGLISFRMDWLDLLAVQGTLKNHFQQHNSKASILQCSALFIVQLSHPWVTTKKIKALTIWTFVGKMMYLVFNVLSRFAIAFLSKKQASFNLMAAVIVCSDFGAQENKICHGLHFSPFYLKWWNQMPWY